MKFHYICTAILLACFSLGTAKTAKVAKANPKTVKTTNDSVAIAQRTQEIKDSLNAILGKAKAGDAAAMNEVGTWYYTGKHVNQDYNQAYDWWKNASLKSDVRAIANLGLCYQFGHGVERDSVDAIRLYEKSIKDGNKSLLTRRAESASQNAFDAMLIGDCYEKGIGYRKDFAKAAAYFAKAADMGSIDGMRQAALAYLNAKDNSNALKYFEKGASAGDLSSQFWAGKLLLGEMDVPGNKPQAVIYLLKAAEAGMPAAQAEVGDLYSAGNGVTKNLPKAAEWYQKSALQGFPKGMWNYALALKDGAGTARDYDQALFWMAEAAPQGYHRAFKNMIAQLDSVGTDPFANYVNGMKLYLIDGNMKEATAQFKKVDKAKIAEGNIMQAVILASKRNEKPNAKKAAKMLEKLAPENAEAAFYLATLYESGNGVGQDIQKAIELYKAAADMNYGKAQSYLADIYYEGRGIDKDIDSAVSLYLKAQNNRQLSQTGALRLAECYESGLGGLQPDKKKSEQLSGEKYQDNLLPLLQSITSQP